MFKNASSWSDHFETGLAPSGSTWNRATSVASHATGLIKTGMRTASPEAALSSALLSSTAVQKLEWKNIGLINARKMSASSKKAANCRCHSAPARISRSCSRTMSPDNIRGARCWTRRVWYGWSARAYETNTLSGGSVGGMDITGSFYYNASPAAGWRTIAGNNSTPVEQAVRSRGTPLTESTWLVSRHLALRPLESRNSHPACIEKPVLK